MFEPSLYNVILSQIHDLQNFFCYTVVWLYILTTYPKDEKFKILTKPMLPV